MDTITINGQIFSPNELPVTNGERIIPHATLLAYLQFKRIVGLTDAHWSRPIFPADHVSYVTRWLTPDGKQPAPFTEITLADGRKQMVYPPHGKKGTQFAWLHPSIPLSQIHMILQKGDDPECDSYSGFIDAMGRSTGLHEYLQAFGIKKLILSGYVVEICEGDTGIHGVKRGYDVSIAEEASAYLFQDAHNKMETRKRLQGEGIKFVHVSDLIEQADPYAQQTRAYWATNPWRVYDPATNTEIIDPTRVALAYAAARAAGIR